MQLLVLGAADVRELLKMSECMRAMATALAQVSSGNAILPLRTVMRLPGKNLFASMPGALNGALGAKVLTVFPENHSAGLESHQGAVLLFDTKTGGLSALMDAASITAVRTAAVSGVATQLLAREDADDLAILGSGVQAESHLEAMLEARSIRRVRVWSRTAANARDFAERCSAQRGINVEAMPSVRDAVDGASIICTTTASREPVLKGDWIAAGAHINAVGAALPDARELDSAAVSRSRLYVDRRDSAIAEAGDFLIPRSEGLFGDDHIVGEIGEIVLGRVAGRQTPEQVTLFKSLGLAVEDIAAAHLLYETALERGAGTRVGFS